MERIQVLDTGEGLRIYTSLLKLFGGRRGKNATTKCLKSGVLYINSVGEPTNPDKLELRMYRTDICVAGRDGSIELNAYNSTTTRRNLYACTKLSVSSQDGVARLRNKVLYEGCIKIDSDGYTDKVTTVLRDRNRRSVLKQFSVWFKPWKQLMLADILLREGERVDALRVGNSTYAFMRDMPEPTLQAVRGLLDRSIAHNQRWSQNRNSLPTMAAYTALRNSVRAEYLRANNGVDTCDWNFNTRKFTDGKSQSE